MGKFIVFLSERAKKDIQKHKRSGDQASGKKIRTILEELKHHPETGTGKPERLKHQLSGYWSRRINHKDWMIYSIDDNTVTVEVVTAMGHY